MKIEDVDLALYIDGMSMLWKSGALEILREVGRPAFIPGNSTNYNEVTIAEHNRSIGYLQALDHLVLFRETFMKEKNDYIPPRDYGAVDFLTKNNIISKEESEKLRDEFKR